MANIGNIFNILFHSASVPLKCICFKLAQGTNAVLPISFIEFGILTSANEVQVANADSPISVAPCGIFMLVRPPQF